MTKRRGAVLGALVLLASTARLAAESPRDELLRLVPADVGFCFVLEDLRGHFAQLAESPFVKQFRTAPMGALLDGDPDWRKLNEGRQQLESLLGVSWTTLRDDVLGHALVFAYRPGTQDQPGREQALILLRTRDAQTLAKLVERLNTLQKSAGELKALEPREHHGLTYFRRVDAKSAHFYTLQGPILAVSSDETMLREALERRAQPAGGEPYLARRLEQLLGTQPRLLSLWINPRAFDPSVEAKAASGRDDEKAVLQRFLTYWKALEGMAVGVRVQDDVTCTFALQARIEQLPAGARRFFAGASGASELWRHFPDDAMFAVAGRFDAAAFLDLIAGFLTPPARQALYDGLDRTIGAALDKDVTKDVLPCLGPDIGCCLIAPTEGTNDWMPHALFAMRVRPGDKPPFIDQALFSALNGLAQAAVIDHNVKHKERMSLKTEMQDKVEVKYLSGSAQLPAGLRPAFALKDGYLLLATSPEAMRQFSFAGERRADADAPLLRVSLKQLRQYLQAHRQPLAAALGAHDKTKTQEIERQIDSLVQGLRLFDRMDISRRTEKGKAALTVRVRTALPLRK